MDKNSLVSSLAESPYMFPESVDLENGVFTFCEMAPETYTASTWLDGRKTCVNDLRYAVPVTLVAKIMRHSNEADAHIIFHTSHCGSTLIANCLNGLTGCFALKEPQILRELSDILVSDYYRQLQDAGHWEDFTLTIKKLLSRTFNPDDRAIIKANSLCHNLIDQLVSADSQSKAVFLYSDLINHLASMLKGDRLSIYIDLYFGRLKQDIQNKGLYTGYDIDALNPIRKAALMWAARVLSFLDSTCARSSGQIRSLDFGAFLESPEIILRRLADYFGIRADEYTIQKTLTGGLLNRNSKHSSFRYSPEQRKSEFDFVYNRHKDEIQSGIAWLAQLLPDKQLIEKLPCALADD